MRPGARHSALLPAAEGEPWSAQLKSPPVDGRANEELIALLAGHFGVAKRAVTITRGAGARLKQVRIDIAD